MKPEIEAWLSDLTDQQREIALDLMHLVLSRNGQLREDFKWGQPCFYGRSMVCYIQKAKAHMSLGFGKGASLADPDGMLEGSGSQMRHVKLPLGHALDLDGLARLVREAIALD